MAKPKKPTKSCSKAGSKLATERDPAAASKLAKCGKTPAKGKPRKAAPTKRECQAAGWSLTEIGSKKAGKTLSACAKKAAKRKGVSTGAKAAKVKPAAKRKSAAKPAPAKAPRAKPAMRTERVTKKQLANNRKLSDLVGGFVMKHGGRMTYAGSDTYFPDYVLPTNLGDLVVHVNGDWIHCRFEDVQRAVKVIGAGNMNPHSGKWNHGCGMRAEADDLFRMWKDEIERIMPPHTDRKDNPSRVWLFDAGESARPRYTMIDTDVMRVGGDERRTVVQWTSGNERSPADSSFHSQLSGREWAALGDCASLGTRIRPQDIADRSARMFAEGVLRAWRAKTADASVPSGFRGELEVLLRSRLGSFGQYRNVESWSKTHEVDPTVEVILEDQALGRSILREDGVEQEVEELARRHGLRYEQSSAHVHLFHRDAGRRSNPGGLMTAPNQAVYDRARYALRVEHLHGRREVSDVARAVYGTSPGVFGADDEGERMEFRFDTAADLRRGYELVMEDIRRHNRQVSWSAREIRSGRSLLASLTGREPWPTNLR